MEQTIQKKPAISTFMFSIRLIIAIIIQYYTISLFFQYKNEFFNLSWEQIKHLKIELITFIKIIGFIYVQIFLIFEFTKLFIISNSKARALKQIKQKHFDFILDKFSKDTNFLKRIEKQEEAKINEILLEKNNIIKQKRNELEKTQKEIEKIDKEIQKETQNAKITKTKRTRKSTKTNLEREE